MLCARLCMHMALLEHALSMLYAPPQYMHSHQCSAACCARHRLFPSWGQCKKETFREIAYITHGKTQRKKNFTWEKFSWENQKDSQL